MALCPYTISCYNLVMTTSNFPTFSDLNLDPAVLEILRSVSRPGLVLLSGTTGQGKSTTLAALGTEFEKDGYKVSSLRTFHDSVLPGVPEIVMPDFGPSMVHVVLIDNLTFQDSYKFAVGLAARDALVIACVHAGSAEYAVQRMIDSYYPEGDGADAVNKVMAMAINQKIVPAAENEFDAAHWAAVGNADILMSIANPSHPRFAYRNDRKVEMTFKNYLEAPALFCP